MNPFLFGLLINVISTGLDKGLSKIFSLDLEDQFFESIENALHSLSEKYPVTINESKYTFWDYVIIKYKNQLAEGSSTDYIAKDVIETTVLSLIDNPNNIYDINAVVEEFWKCFIKEVSGHQELANYLVLRSQEKATGMLEELVSVLKMEKLNPNSSIKFDVNLFKKELGEFNQKITNLQKNTEYPFFHTRNFHNKESKIYYNLEELISEGNSFYIKGEAGSGKSFLLKHYEASSIIDTINFRFPPGFPPTHNYAGGVMPRAS